MKWSIVMPSFSNYTEVYFTVQSLRLHHDLKDAEIVVVDNFGDPMLERFCKDKGNGVVRYEKYTDVQGVSAAKNRAIEIAHGEFVLCIDSHILIKAGALDVTPPRDDLVQGPCLNNNCSDYSLEWKPVWQRNMWGTWAPRVKSLPAEPFEIWATGAGFFACRRDSWLGFNPQFRGFGGETGYLQEKYRKAGRKVWCDPRMVWIHFFCNTGREIPFKLDKRDRVRNYLLGFEEIGLDIAPIVEHFGEKLVSEARALYAA